MNNMRQLNREIYQDEALAHVVGQVWPSIQLEFGRAGGISKISSTSSQRRKTLPQHVAYAISPDNQWLLVSICYHLEEFYEGICVWNRRSGPMSEPIRLERPDLRAVKLTFSPNGQQLGVIYDKSKDIGIYSVRFGNNQATLKLDNYRELVPDIPYPVEVSEKERRMIDVSPIHSAFSIDFQMLAAIYKLYELNEQHRIMRGGTLTVVWNVASGECLRQERGVFSDDLPVSWLNDADNAVDAVSPAVLLGGSVLHGGVRLWDCHTEEVIALQSSFLRHPHPGTGFLIDLVQHPKDPSMFASICSSPTQCLCLDILQLDRVQKAQGQFRVIGRLCDKVENGFPKKLSWHPSGRLLLLIRRNTPMLLQWFHYPKQSDQNDEDDHSHFSVKLVKKANHMIEALKQANQASHIMSHEDVEFSPDGKSMVVHVVLSVQRKQMNQHFLVTIP
jgi:WD40 repeat protein